MKRMKLGLILGIGICVLMFTGCGTKTQNTNLGTKQNVSDTETVTVKADKLDEVANQTSTENEVDKDTMIKVESVDTNAEISNVEMENNEGNRPDMIDITAKDVVKEMKIGWNLGNTLDAHGDWLQVTDEPSKTETAWGNPITSEKLIETVIDKGFNVIRIPVTWHGHLSEDRKYIIDEAWMDRVQEVVDYAYNHDAYVILNVHHDTDTFYSVYENQKDDSMEALKAVWTQIADRFAEYDEHLIFEGMNEPRKIGTDVEWNGGDQEGWNVVNELNAAFVDTIRSGNGQNPYRILMIPGYGANCWEGMKHIQIPEDDQKIIVSVHAYEPYNFALNKDGVDVWNHDTNNIDMIMNNIRTLFINKGIPVVIGEFGAMNKPNPLNEEERAAWAEYYVAAARKYGIPCVWWDNGLFEGDGELFGLIDRKTYEWKYEKVVDALLK